MMNQDTRGAYKYRAAGALPASAQTYVERQADTDLFEALLAGQYCYVLNTRQMGKSSLCVRTMARLRERGVVCATVDLSNVASTEATQEQWYEALLDWLAESFGLLDEEGGEQGTTFERWTRENAHLPVSTRFSKFVEWLVVKRFPREQVVIFFDEIESTLRQSFKSDDFFISLRACYNRRPHRTELNRLTFVLLGVADPSDLIEDKFRTPFNIGRAIELYGFTLEEAGPLAVGLEPTAARPEEVLRAILSWTGGQPFLTHKLCLLVSEAGVFIPAGEEAEHVARIVRERVIENWGVHDNPRHLKTIEHRILESPKRRTTQLLNMYQQILRDGELPAETSPEQMELRLSGLVVNDDGRLKVYNRIYAAIFNEQWVESSLARLRPYAESLLAWYASDCEDESRLLRGNALVQARDWSKGKSLGNDDWRFLTASEQLERRDIGRAFEAEQEARLKLESAFKAETEAKAKVERALQTEQEALEKERNASQLLKQANEKAERREARAKSLSRKIIFFTGLAVVLLAVFTVLFVYRAQQRALKADAEAADAHRAEQLAKSVLEDYRRQIVESEKNITTQKEALEKTLAQIEGERQKQASLTAQAQRARADAAKARAERDAVRAEARQLTKGAEETYKDYESRLSATTQDLNSRIEKLNGEVADLKKRCPSN